VTRVLEYHRARGTLKRRGVRPINEVGAKLN
jgi:hypothetical protein